MNFPDQDSLKEFLELKVKAFNNHSFIELDPISIPHTFSKKEDREISGFLAATIAWGQRPTIIKNSLSLMEKMDNSPAEFIRNHSTQERKQFEKFVHRTFNGIDCKYFLKALQKIYLQHDGLEGSFSKYFIKNNGDLGAALSEWRKFFFSFNPEPRSLKHVSNPSNNSSAKRLCMYLRWMVRKDKSGVDFGIWDTIPSSALFAPLDLHSGRVARSLGILIRKQDDWKAVTELTEILRKFDANDPVKYDFALFGLGVYEKFK